MPRYARKRSYARRFKKRYGRKRRSVKRRGKANYTGKRGRFTSLRPRPAKSTFTHHPWIGADSSVHFPIPRQLKLVPPRMRAKLIYQVQRLVTSSDTLQTKEYRGNSIFDPEVAVGGQQPRGFDEYAVLYSKYYVVGSSITVTSKTIAGSDPAIIGVFASSAAATSDAPPVVLDSNPSDWYAQDRVKAIMPANRDTWSDACQLKYTAKTKQLVPRGTEREDLVTGVGTNPNSVWTWSVNVQRIVNGTGTAMEFHFIETVVYDVIFSAPNPFAES